MSTSSKSNEEMGRLTSVTYNSDTDEVSVVFRVTDPKYKDFALRWARQQEGRLLILGEQLMLVGTDTEMRSSGRREQKDAAV